jgi:hypothetical protein
MSIDKTGIVCYSISVEWEVEKVFARMKTRHMHSQEC